MTPLRLALILAGPLFLAACESPPPQPTAPAETAEPAAAAQPAPAPVPGAPVPPAPTVEAAPTPAPSSARPLSQSEVAALEPLFGTWAVDPKNCGRSAIQITRTRFEGSESGCDITSIVDSGDWHFVATLSCVGQERQAAAERVAMVPLYAPSGEGIGLTYLDRDNLEVTVLRCD